MIEHSGLKELASELRQLREPSNVEPNSLQNATGILVKFSEFVLSTGFLAAIGFYFGWARTRKLYRELGVDHAVLGFSFQDYVIRSLTVLIEPLPIVALYFVGLAATYRLGVSLVRRCSCLFWPIWVIISLIALTVALVAWHERTVSASFAQAVSFFLVYSAVLAFGLAWARPQAEAIETVQAIVITLAAFLLFSFAAFEVVRHHAEAEGLRQSNRAEANPHWYACATIRTNGSIPIGTLVQPAGTEKSQPAVYEGLRLFTRVDGRLFVWPADQSPRDGLAILPEESIVDLMLTPDRGDNRSCTRGS